jgi:hypothetical protein
MDQTIHPYMHTSNRAPGPSSYENRFFRTFEAALPPPPPPLFDPAAVVVRKPAVPTLSPLLVNRSNSGGGSRGGNGGCTQPAPAPEPAIAPTVEPAAALSPADAAALRAYAGPTAFVIPGNHDWYDGLANFLRYIVHRSWLGGWLLPQEGSYFALALPAGWWLLGLDLALDDDVDLLQYRFFAQVRRPPARRPGPARPGAARPGAV